MSTAKKMYDIIDGPNRNDLVAAFLYAYDEDFGKRLCTFTLVDGIQKKRICMCLNVIMHEDGSGHSFMLEGYFGIDGKTVKARGYYHARTRKGWLEPQ